MTDTTTIDAAPNTDGMQAEQAADFASIMAKAAEPEQAQAQAQQAQAQQQAAQQAADLQAQIAETTMMVEFGWTIVGGLLPPKVAERYGPEQRAAIAAAGTNLAIKRGWSMGEFMAKWGAEAAFVGALVGPSIPLIVEWVRTPKKQAEPGQIEQVQPVAQVQQTDDGGAGKAVVAGTVIP